MKYLMNLLEVITGSLTSNPTDQDKFPYIESDSENSQIASIYYSTKDSINEDLPFLSESQDTNVSEANNLHKPTIEGNTSDDAVLEDDDYNGIDNVRHSDVQFSSTNPITNHFLNDGLNPIDIVLVWDQLDPISPLYRCSRMRKTFETNLVNDGLILEQEFVDSNGLHFIKISAPNNVLKRYAEVLQLKLPIKDLQETKFLQTRDNQFFNDEDCCLCMTIQRFSTNSMIFPSVTQKFSAIYSRDKEYLFDVGSPDFFTPATRSRIVRFILDRTKFAIEDEDADLTFGIDLLISERAYSAVYPLHDGTLQSPESLRYFLYKEWSSLNKCLQPQPLDYIKEYFGIKIALYFAWLGFYTHMLIFASVAGLLCFMYGSYTLYSNEPTEDICKPNELIKMCPLCDYLCGLWNLGDTCLYARITHLFDNTSTVLFAIFMSLWATLFLEIWKRYSAGITNSWDMTNLDIRDENPRPQFLYYLARKNSSDFETGKIEPGDSAWKKKVPAIVFGSSTVALLVTLALAAVIGVFLYRISFLLASYSFSSSPDVTSSAILLTTVTTAIINLWCIIILNWFYVWFAQYLTELELQRTESEFNDSLALKIYLLEFINYYASIIYIAFFKGKFIGYPGKYIRIFNHRQEECGPSGCLLELSIQLGIIMIGKQTMKSIMETLCLLIHKWSNKTKIPIRPKLTKKKPRQSLRTYLQWIRDYKLVQWGPRNLFHQYLEVVLQYGFVTIFVSAFPLAPLFALINNVLEMRLDAKKLLTVYRRPVAERVGDIGIWYQILDTISKLSVITNAFIIAFTSSFIPKLVYQLTVSKDNSLKGFLQFSLSKFDINDLETELKNMTVFTNNKMFSQHHSDDQEKNICQYLDYREPPDSEQKYSFTNFYWHVLAARLAFVVIFENFVAFVVVLLRWCIPDMSLKLKDKIRREAHMAQKAIIQHEANPAGKSPENQDEISAKKKFFERSTELYNNKCNHILNKSLTNTELELEFFGNIPKMVRAPKVCLAEL